METSLSILPNIKREKGGNQKSLFPEVGVLDYRNEKSHIVVKKVSIRRERRCTGGGPAGRILLNWIEVKKRGKKEEEKKGGGAGSATQKIERWPGLKRGSTRKSKPLLQAGGRETKPGEKEKVGVETRRGIPSQGKGGKGGQVPLSDDSLIQSEPKKNSGVGKKRTGANQGKRHTIAVRRGGGLRAARPMPQVYRLS